MDWRELLELTTPRIIITVLLLCYVIFTIPVITIHSTYCKQEGVDCSSSIHRVPIYYCLNIGFHWEFQTLSMYSARHCNKTDLLWLFLIIPLLYFISLFVHTKLVESVEAWRYDSKIQLLTCGLLITTLLPGMLFGILETGLGDSLIIAYTVFPFGFFILCAEMIWYGDIVTPAAMIGILLLIGYSSHILFKKWEITHAVLYVMWVVYLVAAFFGVLLIYG